MTELYEKAGLFYLGKEANRGDEASLTLIKNKWLTTHAAIIGMTGSGKTGLGITLIEEAAMDNIPVIVIDPKGDMGNVCLTDPEFRAESFLPWVTSEAEAKGVDALELAKETAARWKKGIESWHQDSSRVARFHRVEKVIYTPGSSSGVAVNILSSLEAPSKELQEDADLFAAYLKSTVTGLLSLIGETNDDINSPAYIVTAKIIRDAWRRGEAMSIEGLIGALMMPPFKKVGVLPLEKFFPQKERFKLANRFNALLASPGFERWLEGETLDIQRMLYTKEGKARIAVFSIAHLNDEERMFFVTLLLNRYIAWMRRQSGTSRLKAMLYMDEIFGFFPPNANPPSKEPMLLLLKQARAFGTGIVLSTQNPVDLDYKGLANIGTWFVGRLQTKQDIARIIDGMQMRGEEHFSKTEMAAMMTQLQSRQFFLKSAYLDSIRLFSTRWVMSYLKGPLDREEIRTLTAPYKKTMQTQNEEVHSNQTTRLRTSEVRVYEPLDRSIPVYFEPPLALPVHYEATLGAKANVRFFNQRRGIDKMRTLTLSLPLEEAIHTINWEGAYEEEEDVFSFLRTPPKEATFGEVPESVAHDKGLRRAERALKIWLYRTQTLEMWRCRALKMESLPDESYGDFVVRVEDVLAQKREEAIEKLQERYAKKEKTLLNRIAKARERVAKEEKDATSSLIDTGIAILGALFGKSTPSKIGRTLSKGTKVLKERDDLSAAKARLERLLEEMEALESELEEKIEEMSVRFSVERYPVEPFKLTPRKSDIDVTACAVVWREA